MRTAALFTALVHLSAAAWAPAVSRAVGTVFSIQGKKQYFTGTNTWWLGHLLSDQDVDLAASQIAKSGLKVTRVWAFGNANSPSDQEVYYQLLDNKTQTISINYGANGIARLDAAVKAAEKYKLQLVLPMLNNWNDLGGIQTYCNYFNCNTTTFYTNEAAQKAYQNWIRFVVHRYKNSPAVFSWELCNEPRCSQCDPSVITNWASKTSAYIKSLDKTHLVTLGDEGWFCGGGDGSYGKHPPLAFGSSGKTQTLTSHYNTAYSCYEGVDFIANLGIRTLDYGTFHMYPDGWGYSYAWGNQWIEEHAALASKYNKPIVLEEYGISSVESNQTAQMREWQATILENDIAYDSFWQFATNLPSGTNPFDVYKIVYGTDYYNSVVPPHVAEMNAKPV
jgi:mannan endo-1,4-beta-mannosidase